MRFAFILLPDALIDRSSGSSRTCTDYCHYGNGGNMRCSRSGRRKE